mmetsp:Transcript_18235/g.31992  ORF Transcript_18235/g.31992 Transcript_18235/m.31992 type:complete len:103 (+) Transcript_18235:669-977(+)
MRIGVRSWLVVILGLFTKWDGNVAACWRHVVVMCVVLLLVLLGYLFYFSDDVAVFVTRAFCIIKRNKEYSVVEKHGFMTAGCGGLPWAASGCPGCRCGSLPV